MNHFHTTGTPAVYRRTTKGQFAAAATGATGGLLMDPQHRRLLLLVNGYTTLDAIARVGHFEAQPAMLAQDLETSGLIEQATLDPPWHLAEERGRAWCFS